mmetsp:Transcript_44503/g.96813  ORF Transcript_44503/g.96813 Transcript_44503/m.96813 type:complete len:230 (-) Transcript_44503:35-724(-)
MHRDGRRKESRRGGSRPGNADHRNEGSEGGLQVYDDTHGGQDHYWNKPIAEDTHSPIEVNTAFLAHDVDEEAYHSAACRREPVDVTKDQLAGEQQAEGQSEDDDERPCEVCVAQNVLVDPLEERNALHSHEDVFHIDTQLLQQWRLIFEVIVVRLWRLLEETRLLLRLPLLPRLHGLHGLRGRSIAPKARRSTRTAEELHLRAGPHAALRGLHALPRRCSCRCRTRSGA